VHELYLSTIPTASAVGRLEEARRLAAELRDVVSGLTPHHRLHGAAVKLEVEELAGSWDAILAFEGELVQAVDENRSTPCVRNPRSLLVCAVAEEIAGSTERSRELEGLAAELDTEGLGMTVDAPRMRLALVRGDIEVLTSLLGDEEWMKRQTWFVLPGAAVRLDALAVVGSHDDVAEAAETFAPAASYVEPFALRALGIVSEDEALLARADDRFRALGLSWYRAQTDRLRALRRRALG